MNCKNCGQPVVMGAKFCGNCGTLAPGQSPPPSLDGISPAPPSHPSHQPSAPQQWQPAPAPVAPAYTPPAPGSPFAGQVSNKNYLTTFLLAYFLGMFGADRFYTGEIGLGLLKFISGGGFGFWALIDVILVLAGARKDKWGRTLHNRQKDFKASMIVFISFSVLGIIANIALVLVVSHAGTTLGQHGDTIHTSTTPTASAPEPVGSTFSLTDSSGNKYDITLNKYFPTPTPATSVDQPNTGQHLAAVQLTVVNRSNQTEKVYPDFDASLVDSSNQSYTSAIYSIKECQPFSSSTDTIPAGQTVSGCAVYSIPNGTTLTKVRYTSGSDVVSWPL